MIDAIHERERLSPFFCELFGISRIETQKQQPINMSDKYCWICLDESDTSSIFTAPCHCIGSTKYCHQRCLLKWLNESNHNTCPSCGFRYIIIEPKNRTLSMMNLVDSFLTSVSYPMAFVGMTFSAITLSTTYGIYAFVSFLGHEHAEKLLEESWTPSGWIGIASIPWLLLISRFPKVNSLLVLFPPLLLSGKSIQFKSPAAILVSIPIIRLIYNTFTKWVYDMDALYYRDSGYANANETKTDLVRFLVGALAFPAIASLAGSLVGLLPWLKHADPFHRNLLGGSLFIIMKDASAYLHDRQKRYQFVNRHIKNMHNETSS